MQLIRKRWQGHNDALLARQIRTSSGATNLLDRTALPPRVALAAVAPPMVEAPPLVPLWLLDAEREELSDRALRLLVVLEGIARAGDVMPIEDVIAGQVGGVTAQAIKRDYAELERAGHIRRESGGKVRAIELRQMGMVVSNSAVPRAVSL